ncbi:MAG: DEAD/DEAH box helicase [Pseudoprimorskyibacter sp.]|nr:DEAD/DEAH box helicase [Pseudoprimorskyibacter sp.]
MNDFQSLGLAPSLQAALQTAGLSEPTPIQAQAIPHALAGHDVMGLAQTGTGKTLAFGLPLVHGLLDDYSKPASKTAKALILAPTRELVGQIADSLRPLLANSKLRITTVVGGQSLNRQVHIMARGTDILVATPGRLIDLIERKAVHLNQTRQLVLDEADQMLDMGFIHALRKIAPLLGTPRRTMLFSATMPKQMEELSRSYLTNPKKVQVAPPGKAADKVTQSLHYVTQAEKPGKLRDILQPEALTLVFARTKHGAERLMKGLVRDGYKAASIHGNKSQGQRDRALAGFRAGEITVLVATDVAARGIDIPGVAFVINYDLPNVPENYIHRIGRTARAGREGEAIAFCAPDEMGQLKQIEKVMKITIPVTSGRPFQSPVSDKPATKQRPSGKPRSAANKPAGNAPRRRRPRRSKAA